MDTYNLSFPDVAIDAILATAYELQNAGYIFRGVASELYGTPTERSWVLAGEGETGHGFTSPVPKGYIGVCVFNGTSWTGKLLKCVSIDSTPTNGSTNAVSSGGTYASINQLATMVNEALDNLTFTDSTPSAFLGEYITEKVSTTNGGIERIMTYFTILAATAEKAGLLSAADKQKIDSFLGIVRSLEIDDTTAYADLGTKIVESIKATIGGQEETISTFQILAATAEKAGLLSAADKQKIDAFLDNLRSLEIDDTTADADLGTKIVESIKATIGGTEETISTFQILGATASKAGLLSAADKAKLDALWSSGYQFVGIATPSTTPISTTSKIFYIATEAGTYFNAVTVTQGINLLSWDGTSWSAVQVIGIDDEPTAGSDRLVKSGGVFGELALGAVYDVSAKNPTAGPNSNGKWESLSALLSDANLNTLIPTSVRKGGMSIKYVQSSDNKYVQYRLMADEFTTDTTQWAIADEGVYIENPEFVYVKTDSEGKLLWAIKIDGGIYYGAGVPQQVKDYIEEKIAELSLDEYEDIVAFLNDLEKGDKTLQNLLDEKVDKEEGKSLIDAEYANGVHYIENPEFVGVTLDAEDKVLEGIQADGTKVIGGDINVLGNMEVSGVSYKVIENPEYLAAWLDAEDKVIFGFKTDGKTYVGDADFLDDIESIKAFLANFNDKNIDLDALTSITATENPELIEAKTDSEGKLLAGRTTDGAAFENVGFSAPKVSIDGHSMENVEDPEERTEILTDAEGKIISYRDGNGVKHEEVGIETQQINSDLIHSTKVETEDLEVKNTQSLKKQLNVDDKNDRFRLPDYGYVNIKSEQFFLEAHSGVTNINDVVPIRMYPDTYDNGQKRIARSFYYVKNTLTDNGDGTYSVNANSVKLRFFASGKVKLNTTDNKYYAKDCVRKINGVCYYHDTLICSRGYSIKDTVLDGYTVEAEPDPSLTEGGAKMVNTEVVPMTGTPCIEAWTVEDFDFTAISGTDIGKKYGHNCIVDVDFGDYYTKNNVPIEIKYQGNSTNSMIKRGLRFTFYKNSNYAKKDKIKIGEMIRLSGFNLKAEYLVPLVKEYVTYKLINDVWNSRPITDRFDWDNKVNGYFHEATGTMKTFPTRVDIGSDFYGIYFFGTKKDEKTCMLDGEDESGLYISASTNGSNAWGVTLPYNVTANYEDEMLDELSPTTIAALETWHHFIHNRLYKGSDNNEYNITELTEVAGNMYVTSTLVDGEVVEDSIMATLIEFNKHNIPDRLDVLGFIDYLIFIQVFFMTDSWHNNMMLYSNDEKKKIWPFFYDVDNSWGGGNQDFVEYIEQESNGDMSLWEDFMDIYWDDIINRYHLLRKEIINESHINAIHEYISNIIPESDYANETARWGRTRNQNEFIPYISALTDRLEYLDKIYYK